MWRWPIFDIQFNYGCIQWDAGEASGGDANCQHGTSARAGHAGGSGEAGAYLEIFGSGADGGFFDTNTVSGLIHGSFNGSQRAATTFRSARSDVASRLWTGLAVALAVVVGLTEADAHTITPAPHVNTTTFNWAGATLVNPSYNSFAGVTQVDHARKLIRGVTVTGLPGQAEELLLNPAETTGPKHVKNTLWKSRMAAGVLPRLRTLGAITSEMFVGDVGWKIGRVIDAKFLKLTPADYCSIVACIWQGDTRTEPAQISTLDGDTWMWAWGGSPASWQLRIGASLTMGWCRSGTWYYAEGYWRECLQAAGREAIGLGTNIGTATTVHWANCNQYGNLIPSSGSPDDLPPGAELASYACMERRATEPQMENALRPKIYKPWEAGDGEDAISNVDAPPAENTIDPGTALDVGDPSGTGAKKQTDHWVHPDPDYPSPTPEANLNQPAPTQPVEQSYGTCDGSGAHAVSPSACLSDPVNTLTGAFTLSVEDVSLPGTGVPLVWTRAYTSADATVGRLGPGWTDSYATSLTVLANGDVRLRGDEGQQVLFTRQTDGSFTGAPGSRSGLSAITGGYRLVRHDQVVYLFDGQGRLTSMKDRNNEGLSFGYDASGRMSSITDSASRQITLSYTADGLLSQLALPDGRSVGYGYTAGRLTSVVDVRGKTWTYTYDAGGRLATVVDPLNRTEIANVYDASSGRVIQQTDALGKTTAFTWDAATQTATITDANNNTWKDVYAGNVLVKRIDPLNNATQLDHDLDLNDTAVTGPDGVMTTMTYDANGNLLTATAPASLGSAQKTFAYNGRNDPTSVTDARGEVTGYGYDTAGNNTTVTQDGTAVATYASDAQGRVTSFTDGNGKTTTYAYDASGNVASVTDPLGNETTYTYDAVGRVLTRVDPKGNLAGANPADFTWSYTYNAAGQVLTETDPLGNRTSHTYDDAGNEISVTDANLKTTSYAYDAANRLLSVTAPDGGVTRYTYDSVGNRLTETDPLNQTTTFTYDAANRLASVTTPSGAKTTYFYDASGNLVKTVAPRGNVSGAIPDEFATIYTYDAAGRLLTETDPLGNRTSHVYDAVGNEISVTDPRNNTTSFEYDGKNRLITVTAPATGVIRYTYDAAGNRLSETDPLGNTTSYAYDTAGRLLSVTGPDPDGPGPEEPAVANYSYDANGNQISTVEPRGNVAGANPDQYRTTYAYDRANRRTAETNQLGNTTTTSYDSVGNVLSVTDANNHRTSYSYDPANRLLTVTAPDLGDTSYSYDLAGNLTTRTDAKNHTTSYAYDADNRRVSVTSPIGQVWTTSYDPDGNVATTVDANGNATTTVGDGTISYAYDGAGRVTTINYSDTTPDVTFVYDAAGNRTQMSDGEGTETRTYDTAGRLTGVTRGTDTFSYAYDPAGNLTSRTYPGGAITAYTYDQAGRLATVTSDGATSSYAYDVAGNLTQTTLPATNGYTETRTYDRAGRLTDIRATRPSAVTGSEARIPDGVREQTNLGGTLTDIDEDPDAPDTLWMVASNTGVNTSVRVAFATPAYAISGMQTFKAAVRKKGGSSTPTARIDLYENGVLRASGSNQNISSTTGVTIIQTFNVDLLTLIDPTGAGIEARLVGTAAGSGGKSATVEVGALRWTAAAYLVSPQTLTRFTYTLDPVGNPTQLVTLGGAVQYRYDALGRLTEDCQGPPTCDGISVGTRTAWTYDAVGNRLTEEVWWPGFGLAAAFDYTYDGNDRLLSRESRFPLGAPPVTYSYDHNGNQISAGITQFTYDQANRLISIGSSSSPCPVTDSYGYDGDGKRLAYVETSYSPALECLSQTTNYLWDVAGSLPNVALERLTGSQLRRYSYGHGRLSQTSPGGTFYYHPDKLGSVASLTSANGAKQWAYDYEPYGEARSTIQHAAAAPANIMRFTGEQLDPTGLYHLRARHYDPGVGRFLQVDPVEPAQRRPGLSTYVYADDRPTVLVDPTGARSEPIRVGMATARFAASHAATTPPRGLGRSLSALGDSRKPKPGKGLWWEVIKKLLQGPDCRGDCTGVLPTSTAEDFLVYWRELPENPFGWTRADARKAVASFTGNIRLKFVFRGWHFRRFYGGQVGRAGRFLTTRYWAERFRVPSEARDGLALWKSPVYNSAVFRQVVTVQPEMDAPYTAVLEGQIADSDIGAHQLVTGNSRDFLFRDGTYGWWFRCAPQC